MDNKATKTQRTSIPFDKDTSPHLRKQISSEYNINELSQLQKTLSGQYRNLDISSINDVLKVICIGKQNKQSFSFLIDVCSLVSVGSVDKDDFTLQKLISDHHINVFDSTEQFNFSKEDFSNACKQYTSAFGDCVEPIADPEIKIKDSLFAFMSYTMSMSNAIKQYVDPKPPICPLIIDFWIIPNLTIGADGPLENEIGDIEHRLESNQLTYIKKTCTPKNIDLNIDNIMLCLSSKDITNALDQRKSNRVVFIIDRRFSTIAKGKDFMYCYVPPNEYAKLLGKDDIMSICHAYCCSNYLLPKSSQSPSPITGLSPLNGYLFMLSFLIYEREENDQIERKEGSRNEEKEGSDDEEKERSDDMQEFTDMDDQKESAAIYAPKVPTIQINSLSQISTAFVKCYFHHQGLRLRFFPDQIWTIWKKRFFERGNVALDEGEINKIVSSAFGLYLYDPQIDLPGELQQILHTKADVDYVIKSESESVVNDTKRTLCAKAIEFKKEYCQRKRKKKQKKCHEQLLILERVIDTIDYQYHWEEDSKAETPQYVDRIVIQSHNCSAPPYLIGNGSKLDQSTSVPYYPSIENVSEKMMKEMITFGADSRLISNVYHALCDPRRIEMMTKESMIDVAQLFTDPLTELEIPDASLLARINGTLSLLNELYCGAEFMNRNQTLLINDSFIPYAYYTFIFSHVIKELSDYSPFQFCISFIARDIVSTDEAPVTAPHFLGNDIDGPLSSMERIEIEGTNISDDIAVMFQFMRRTIPVQVNNQRINVVVDRRNQIPGETTAVIYVHYSPMYGRSDCTEGTQNEEFVPFKVYSRPKDDKDDDAKKEESVPVELSTLSMNMTSSIPNLTRSQNNNPFLMHLNFYPLDGKQCLGYFIRNGSCIRFFPEIMMDYWRRFFFNDAVHLRNIAYHHKFRHSFALPLYDDAFTETYYCLHRVHSAPSITIVQESNTMISTWSNSQRTPKLQTAKN